MARTAFAQPEANIVVSTDGYFDVYPATERVNGDKPAYRGRLARGVVFRQPAQPAGGVQLQRPWLLSVVHGTQDERDGRE